MIKNIPINDIPQDLAFEGYVWYSNKQKPNLFNNQSLADQGEKFTDLPFVIEGNLHSKAANLTYHIQNIDSQYIVTEYDFSQMSEDQYKDNKYLANSKADNPNYWMREGWEAVDIGAGVESLEPSWSAFIGFTK